MYFIRVTLFILWLFILLLGCQPASVKEKPVHVASQAISISPNFSIDILDSLAATTAIVKDDAEDFFNKITALDMSIQMRQNYPVTTPRSIILKDYRSYLQRDVTSFSKTEIDFVQRAFLLASERIKALNINILPPKIELIKTTAQHYGESTFYTRENRIIIPYNELITKNLEQFTDIMLHEIFHIYSRQHPQQRLLLYKLIGFQPLRNIRFRDGLAMRLLLNPDGIDFYYGIPLKNGDITLVAIPLIVSNAATYQAENETFFEYVQFNLYPLQRQVDSSFIVHTKDEWQSPIDYADFPDFYLQIRDNTNYIIHPDEILADNFVLLVNDLNGKKGQKRLSQIGRELLEKMWVILEH